MRHVWFSNDWSCINYWASCFVVVGGKVSRSQAWLLVTVFMATVQKWLVFAFPASTSFLDNKVLLNWGNDLGSICTFGKKLFIIFCLLRGIKKNRNGFLFLARECFCTTGYWRGSSFACRLCGGVKPLFSISF